MSGFLALLRLDGRPASPPAVHGALETLAHRGRHGSGVWMDGPVALGRQMTHGTPEAVHETAIARRGPLSLVADLRLDNAAELIHELGLAGDAPVTDPEIVLAAYQRWGASCPEHLLGAFAFALWDAAEQRLFAARDVFGVRPLVVAHQPGVALALASEARTLVALGVATDALDRVEIADVLLAPVQPDVERTVYQDIRALAPAHTLTATSGHVERRRYWALDPERELSLGSDDAYSDAFAELFDAAVRCRLRTSQPVGSLLSGGIDSSSVTCVAAQHLDGDLTTYSAVFPDVPASDESVYIDAVTDATGARARHFRASAVSPLTGLDEMLDAIDRPLGPGNLYLNHTLYGWAAGDGVGVVLDGFDGDTTVSHGTGRFNELRAQRRWRDLSREVRAYARSLGQSPGGAWWSWMRGPVLGATGIGQIQRVGRYARRRLRPETTPVPLWRALASPALANVIAEAAPPRPMRFQTERDAHYALLERPIMAQFAEVLDLVGARHGVSVRMPFFDRRLVEFCLALPADQKLRGGRSRFVLHQAMRGVLPDRVQHRARKTSVAPSFERGLIHFERARIEAFTRDLGPAADILDPDAFRALAADALRGAAGSDQMVTFWRAFSLALWMRRRDALAPLSPPLSEPCARSVPLDSRPAPAVTRRTLEAAPQGSIS